MLIKSVEFAPAVIVSGEKLATAPAGTPSTVSDTLCAEPLITAVEMVEVVEPLGPTAMLMGDALIEKSFVIGVTVRLSAML